MPSFGITGTNRRATNIVFVVLLVIVVAFIVTIPVVLIRHVRGGDGDSTDPVVPSEDPPTRSEKITSLVMDFTVDLYNHDLRTAAKLLLPPPTQVDVGAGVSTEKPSPQAQALEWITRHDELKRGSTDDRLLQRYVVAVLYFALDGFYATTSRWLTEVDECLWEGITCTTVLNEEITLKRNGKPRKVPGDRFHDQYVSSIDTSFWKSVVTTPFRSMPLELVALNEELVELRLCCNVINLLAPAILSRLTNLEHLDVAYNSDLLASSAARSKELLETIGTMTRLKTLNLQGIGLLGSLPSTFGTELTDLQTVDLSYNNIVGSLPASLGGWRKLVQFSARYNQLSGSIPASLGLLPNLKHLNLQHNQFTGVVPESLGDINSLETLELNYNRLRGSVAPEICEQLGSQNGFVVVDCAGDVPLVICDCCMNC